MEKLLEVKDLKVSFFTEEAIIKAVDGIDFSIDKGDVLAMVGESGCGKSVTALSMLKLISPPGRIISGKINFKNTDILSLKEEELQKIRGKEISMIFQNPFTSLNPVLKIGEQISETIEAHAAARPDSHQLFDKTVKMLEMVELPQPEKLFNYYPHMLSGGMQQRVMIAMALCTNPDLLIADEPTTALDVTISSQILKLLKNLKEKFDMSIMLITHNFGIVSEISNKALVMYLGRVMEFASTQQLIKDPLHPYSQGLINAIPKLEAGVQKGKRFTAIEGSVHSDLTEISGCRFYPRCPKRQAQCLEGEPVLKEVMGGHFVRCVLV